MKPKIRERVGENKTRKPIRGKGGRRLLKNINYGTFKKMFSGPTKEEIEKDITRKEVEIGKLREHIRANEARIENYKRGVSRTNYSTLEWENQRDEKRIADIEKQITDLKKQLLRM
jgi:septal ring factor EnvC (AmiA/AmiB activator)